MNKGYWDYFSKSGKYAPKKGWQSGDICPDIMVDDGENKQYSFPVIAVCFDNATRIAVAVIEYEEKEEGFFYFSFLDAHTGEEIEVKKWMYIGSVND